MLVHQCEMRRGRAAGNLAENLREPHAVRPPRGGARLGRVHVPPHDDEGMTSGELGGFGVGIGASEVEHVLATETLTQRPQRTMAVTVEGELPDGVTAKDVVLALIAKIGTGGGQGYLVEYRGAAIEAMS